MAVAVTKDKIALFESMFKIPSLEDMHSLDPTDFERFVAYVFTCAGYTVEHVAREHLPFGPGVDLNLYASPGAKKPIARVEVKRYAPANKVSLDEVKGFNGAIHHGEHLPGYFVTTSDFHPNARAFAQETHGMLRLLNGGQLVRYITYVRGSRIMDSAGLRRTTTLTPPDWLCNGMGDVQCDPKRTTVLTVANGKGGVGKTTSVINFGIALAKQGQRVLLVDLDGQASLSAALPLPNPNLKAPKSAPIPTRERFISDYFSGHTPQLSELVQPTRFDNVWLLPANDELHRMDTGGSARIDAELAFVRAIHDAKLSPDDPTGEAKPFDWIIIDTPPAQSYYTRLALAAAHYVVVPIHVETFGQLGINRVLSNASTMKALVGNGVRVVGCLITCWRKTAKSTKDELPKLQVALHARGVKLFLHAIPYEDRIEQAHLVTSGGGIKSIFGFGTNDAATRYTEALAEFVKEVSPHVH